MGSMLFFSNFINIAILVVGSILIHNDMMKFSDLVAFLLYVGMFMKPLMQLMGFTEMYQRGLAGYRRFYEIMEQKPEIVDKPEAKDIAVSEGEIVFNDIDKKIELENILHPYVKKEIENIKKLFYIAFVSAFKARKRRFHSAGLCRCRLLLDRRGLRTAWRDVVPIYAIPESRRQVRPCAFLGQCQGDALKLFHNMLQFHFVAFEELAPCGRVEKQVSYANIRSDGAGYCILLNFSEIGYCNLRAGFIFLASGFESDFGNGCYGRQRFSTEAVSEYSVDVFGACNL